MIDVYAAVDLFPADADQELGDALTHAVLRAEGVAAPGGGGRLGHQRHRLRRRGVHRPRHPRRHQELTRASQASSSATRVRIS
jgi:hypothetical protein